MEDGTYKVTDTGLELVTLTHGYTVAIRPVDNSGATEYPTGTLLGKWTDKRDDSDYLFETETVYWDEVEVIESRLDAGNIARARGELAVWDNLNNCEMRV